jgi:hypothetical protein
LQGQKRRIVGRLQRKIEDAVTNNPPADSIEVTAEELVEIKSAFAAAKFPAVLSKFIIQFEDQFDEPKV